MEHPIPDPARPAGSPGSVRHVVSHLPRGLCVITLSRAGADLAVPVQTMVALGEDPPQAALVLAPGDLGDLVLGEGEGIGISVVSSEDERLSRQLLPGAPLPLDPGACRRGPHDVPVLSRSVAWIEAAVHAVEEAGGLLVVLADVRSHGESSLTPMVEYLGGYGDLTVSMLAAPDENLRHQLALVDRIREEMESVAFELGCRVVAQTLVDDQLVFLASAGHISHYVSPVMTVGNRAAVVPPLGALFLAWAPEPEVERWLGPLQEPDERARARAVLARVRDSGYTVYLRSEADTEVWALSARGQLPVVVDELSDEQRRMVHGIRQDPAGFGPDDVTEVEWLAVPVFGEDSRVALILGVEGLDYPRDWEEFEARLARLEQAASMATRAIGGKVPLPGAADRSA
ncbi:hypothetical protein [Nocardioides sp. BYT-33-1]|uniref:hypothetical protein n=1 Tax=Nocardioides sp. BYT-33-1 TaxID=3416952 RepID=UPI003F5345C4